MIINGDFWDGYLCNFNQFITSPWTKLFPLLKSKKAVYIFGNHDQERFSDARVSLFSDIQIHTYSFTWGKKKIVFEHGNRLLPLIDEIIPFRFINRILTYISENRLLNAFIKMNKLDYKSSKKVQDKIITGDSETIYICGHTHHARDDQKNRFINSGAIKGGTASYIVITDERIELRGERY